ncbi:cysteine--tRNA ligase [Alkalibaculum sp. M08DMB]|uniref:Cysteine--tRNA ligase n=1 Tax=Alkalibaculum sporogenes TaxID=2655001 RepID=A0A6A7K5Q4_9FIRM|nr:cysteine--tRNA ligase [Alkalibaculum sporogenes]MPW24748.1 cysteine--tRNA ligase [Alkalibaculum sporogenes]
MRLYNTLKQRKEEFIPINEKHVKMYVCGPTVYNFFHIGNARPFIVFDVLRRYFEYIGYKVEYIQNFTDVDDKIINKAFEEGISPTEVSEKYIKEYFVDADGLGVNRATAHPKVSENIDAIINMIEKLIENGLAYDVDGNVYYRVAKFKSYGKLSKQATKDLENGASGRILINTEKEDPLDFALWKKEKSGELSWDSPWGKGRPGWHIECSAMSRKFLGDTIDIHGGGQDLIFPHHENEIAQSEGTTNKPFANYWIHNGYININNEKMSKSKGNFFTIRDISQEIDLEVVRFFILSAQYRNPINFSKDLLKQANTALSRLYNTRDNLLFLLENNRNVDNEGKIEDWVISLSKYKKSFKESMDDDLNTAEALAVLFELSKEINSSIDESTNRKSLEECISIFNELTNVLGVVSKNKEKLLDVEIEEMIERRQIARINKDFAMSDLIRDELKEKGIILEDTRDGVKWKRVQ